MTVWLKGGIRDIELLTIFLNLENVDRELVITIVNEIRSEFFAPDQDETNYFRVVYFEPNPQLMNRNLSDDESLPIQGIELKENIKHIKRVKQKVKDILIRNSIADYVVTMDHRTNNDLIVLKRSAVQSAGELHCRHCGMEFENDIQLGNHLRMHYMI